MSVTEETLEKFALLTKIPKDKHQEALKEFDGITKFLNDNHLSLFEKYVPEKKKKEQKASSKAMDSMATYMQMKHRAQDQVPVAALSLWLVLKGEKKKIDVVEATGKVKEQEIAAHLQCLALKSQVDDMFALESFCDVVRQFVIFVDFLRSQEQYKSLTDDQFDEKMIPLIPLVAAGFDYRYLLSMKPIVDLVEQYPRLKYCGKYQRPCISINVTQICVGITRDALLKIRPFFLSAVKSSPDDKKFWKSQVDEIDVKLYESTGIIDKLNEKHKKAEAEWKAIMTSQPVYVQCSKCTTYVPDTLTKLVGNVRECIDSSECNANYASKHVDVSGSESADQSQDMEVEGEETGKPGKAGKANPKKAKGFNFKNKK